MDDENTVWEIIAIGIGIGCGLAGLGYCLYYIILAVGTIINGALVSVALSPWLIKLTGVGIGVGALTGGVLLVKKVTVEAKKKPFEWALPVLAIISGLVIDTCKEFYETDNEFIRIIYSASVTGMFLIGGILWTQKKVRFKVISSRFISVLFFLTPPVIIYINYCNYYDKSVLQGFSNMPLSVSGSIVLLLLFLVMVTTISWIFKE